MLLTFLLLKYDFYVTESPSNWTRFHGTISMGVTYKNDERCFSAIDEKKNTRKTFILILNLLSTMIGYSICLFQFSGLDSFFYGWSSLE